MAHDAQPDGAATSAIAGGDVVNGAALSCDEQQAVLRENQRLRAELAASQSALADLRERFALLSRATAETNPLPVLREVAAMSRRLREVEAEQVQAALARGFSYAEIAAELGVTRQSVHQKHPRRSAGDSADTT